MKRQDSRRDPQCAPAEGARYGGNRMNELFFVVTLVAMLLGGQQVGTATGFFYAKSDSIYFVTNRHVIIDETRDLDRMH